ncbi:MAG: branched-chain amino acid ABC transporter permease [Firmicutes bacterium]|nr:branched-chain amino acid ABC transporter permease [Bacillota bacterium]
MLVNWPMLIQQVVNGLTVGCLYALIAIGYTMVYGILRLINFAHGDIFMMAMYFAFFGITVFLIPWWAVMPLVVVVTTALGVLIEQAAYKPLREAPRISLLISAIGVSYLLENLATVLFTGIPRSFPSVPHFTEMVIVGQVRIQWLGFWVPLIVLALVVGLMFIVHRTKTGMGMRAVSKDMETAKLMGVHINRIIATTFGIGSALAAVGAMLWGMKYPQMQPYVGVMPGLKCFIAAVIGGIGNITGAIIGGILLGLLEILIVYFFPGLSGYKDAFAFIALILILLLKPTGLMGEVVTDKV